MKTSILLIAALLSVNSNADLKAQARREKSWQPIEIQLPEMAVPAATGYLTGSGWRIDQIAPELEVRSELISDYASGLGAAQFAKHCGRMGYGFATVRELGRKHKIVLRLPDWENAIEGVRGPQPMRIVKARSKVAFEAKSSTLVYGGIDPRLLERSVESQVQSQLDLLRTQGKIEVDITGHDYMACDFVSGQMHIGIEVVWDYPGAKLKRTPTLRAEDLAHAVEAARSGFAGGNSCQDAQILASAIFATSLNAATGKKIGEIGHGTYVSAFNGIYDHSACTWRKAGQVKLQEIAQEFDHLSEGRTQAPTRVLSRFSGVIQ